MAQTYRNDPITVVRDARQGDTGFDASKEQSLVKMSDGTQQVVLKSDIKNS